jgi:hypothetical protein
VAIAIEVTSAVAGPTAEAAAEVAAATTSQFLL